MTIAAGFRCTDGIVLATDSQITFGDIKTYEGKIRFRNFRNLTIAIAGAGDTDYIRTAEEAIFRGIESANTLASVEEHLKRRLVSFFKDHLAPWRSFPRADRPEVELLIGVSMISGGHELFYCRGTSFFRVYHQFIGAGVVLANMLVEGFGVMQIDGASTLAVYVISRVKDSVEGCGGKTGLMAIGLNGQFGIAMTDDIDKVEKALSSEYRYNRLEFLSKAVQQHRIDIKPIKILAQTSDGQTT